MLAFVGWLWPGNVGTFTSDDVTTVDPVGAIMQASPQFWAQFIVLCGTIEAAKYKAELDGSKSFTGEGDAFLDWSGQWSKLDDAGKKKVRMQELKHARLAMLGVIGLVFEKFFPGTVPVTDYLMPLKNFT